MLGIQTQARFFGLDLPALLRDLLTAWRGMLAWPVFAWLWPSLPVRLWLPDGSAVLSRAPGSPYIETPERVRAAHFEAVQLPEHLLLRNVLVLPNLQPYEMQSALSLHVTSLSPFAQTDLVWAYALKPSGPDSSNLASAHLVMTSRKLVAQYLAQLSVLTNPLAAEVWVPGISGQGDLVLQGFGETNRARHAVLWRWASALLVGLVLALAAAILLTPSIQLYRRSLQAHSAMADLQQKAAPVVKQRESLVHTSDQLTNLAELIGKPLPALTVLKLVSDALPDDTSLLSLQVQGTKVTLSGQTANAAALMKQLGTTPGLRDVTAPTPATKPLGAPREQFTIEFALESAQPSPAK